MWSCVKFVLRGERMSTFSHDAVRINGSHEEMIDGALYCEYRELSKDLKYGTEILVGQVIFKSMGQNSQNNVLINNSRTSWPT